MTEQRKGSGDLQWRQILEQVAKGQAVEIPCASDEIAERRTAQATRRAAKAGVEIEVVRNGTVLRLEPRGSADEVRKKQAERQEARQQKQAERAERRKAARGDRGRRKR